MDGCFALNGHTPRNPLTGGLAGLVKTASHEWPEVACKSLDLAHDLHDVGAIAQQIVDELFLKGPSEVGITAHGRCETRLVRKALNGEVGSNSISAADVIVVTGGARGVTAAVSLAVAKAYQCKLLLLGRSAIPTMEPEWLKGLTEEGSIKKAIAKQTQGATPRVIEEQFRRIMGNREITTTLRQIEEAGATVVYRSLDVRDGKAVQSRDRGGKEPRLVRLRESFMARVVLQDRLIEQKTSEQFEEVFSTKVGGFNALLDAAKDDDLKVIVAFSSSTGRFGRKGQVAYAAANEVLNKLAQREGASAAAVPGVERELGAVGRRDGDAAASARFRKRGSGVDSARSRCGLPRSGNVDACRWPGRNRHSWTDANEGVEWCRRDGHGSGI